MKGKMFGLLLFLASFGAYAGDAVVSWDPPLLYEDGSSILAGEVTKYTVLYGQTDGGPYAYSVDVPGDVTTATITGLAKGAWYFVATATTSNGMTSGYSNQAAKSVQGSSKPRPPRNVR